MPDKFKPSSKDSSDDQTFEEAKAAAANAPDVFKTDAKSNPDPVDSDITENLPDFEAPGGKIIENENDPTPEIGLSNDITDSTTEQAATDAEKSVAEIHDLHDVRDDTSLSDEEIKEQLERSHGNPEGTIVPERGSVDFNKLRE